MKTEAIIIGLVICSIFFAFAGLGIVSIYPAIGLLFSGFGLGLMIAAGIVLIIDLWRM